MSAPGRPAPWWIGPAGVVGAWLVLLLGRTWRIEWKGAHGLDERPGPAEGCIFAFWHARMLPLAFTHRGRGGAVLVSRSRDGELIARVLERLGFVTARGSSTRGGGEAALEMVARAGEGRMLGITPDGPRGPAERVKPGLAWLASRTGRPVVPLAAAADRAWVLRSWDAFRVPMPFARVCVGLGEPVIVPPGLDEQAAEAWRDRLEEALRRITLEMRTMAGEGA